MSDEKLAELTRRAATDLSYFNAAEGECWRDEAKGRSQARANFQALKKACEERGIDWNPEKIGYLV